MDLLISRPQRMISREARKEDAVARVSNGATHRRPKTRFTPGYGFVACELAPAQSHEETLVFVDCLDGFRAAALVSSGDVRPAGPVTAPRKGELIVTVVQRVDRGFLIELQQPINSPGRVPVPEKAVTFP